MQPHCLESVQMAEKTKFSLYAEGCRQVTQDSRHLNFQGSERTAEEQERFLAPAGGCEPENKLHRFDGHSRVCRCAAVTVPPPAIAKGAFR